MKVLISFFISVLLCMSSVASASTICCELKKETTSLIKEQKPCHEVAADLDEDLSIDMAHDCECDHCSSSIKTYNSKPLGFYFYTHTYRPFLSLSPRHQSRSIYTPPIIIS